MTVQPTPELIAEVELAAPALLPDLQRIMDAMEKALLSGPTSLEEFRRLTNDRLPPDVVAKLNKAND
jgi:hypothetical protein